MGKVTPDGGWGWVIAFCAFFNNILADGTCYTFGVFIPSIIDKFHVSRFAVGWITSLQMGLLLCVGPLASLLGNRIGFRALGCLGSVIAATGMIMASFAESLAALYVTMGLIVGVGLGFVYLSGMAMVSMYFDEKRAFATGVAVSGSGAGVFLFGQCAPILIDMFEWRGACLILAGILLNGCVSSLLLRPLPKEEEDDLFPELDSPSSKALERLINSQLSNAMLGDKDGTGIPLLTLHGEGGTSPGSKPLPNLEAIKESLVRSHSMRSHAENVAARERVKSSLFGSNYLSSVVDLRDVSRIRSQSSIAARAAVEELHFRSLASITKVTLEKEHKTSALVQLFCNCPVFTNPAILLFTTANVLALLVFVPPFTYVAERARSLQFSESESRYLLPVIGGCNCISRIVFGYIASFPRVNKVVLFMSSTLFLAVLNALFLFCVNFWSFILYSILFGTAVGILIMLQTVVLCDMVQSSDALPAALGMFTMMMAPAVVMANPVAGLLVDSLQSFEYLFLYCSLCWLLAFLLIVPLPFIVWRRNKKEQELIEKERLESS